MVSLPLSRIISDADPTKGGVGTDNPNPVPDLTGVGAINDILGFHIRLAHMAAYRHFNTAFAHLERT